jgi:threonine synthase
VPGERDHSLALAGEAGRARGEGGLAILELSNGPTLAFKDMAMQLLGNLFEYVLARQGEEINILGATSGDTGSSAEYAMRGKKGVRVFMLSPHERMSAVSAGTDVFAARCEHPQHCRARHVRRCPGYRQGGVQRSRLQGKVQNRRGQLDQLGTGCGTDRLLLQGYFAATAAWVAAARQVAFAVPSGNFGNICAGHIARMMGLPIGRLVLATNENDVLDEFFRTGVYRPRAAAETCATSSPSMDISKASNFERFAFDLVGRDPAVIRQLWQRSMRGSFDLSGTPFLPDCRIRLCFRQKHACRSSGNDPPNLREIWPDDRYAHRRWTQGRQRVANTGMPMVVLETALPAKFEETMVEALGRRPERPASLQGIENLPQRVAVIDVSVEAVKRFIEQHLS